MFSPILPTKLFLLPKRGAEGTMGELIFLWSEMNTSYSDENLHSESTECRK